MSWIITVDFVWAMCASQINMLLGMVYKTVKISVSFFTVMCRVIC